MIIRRLLKSPKRLFRYFVMLLLAMLLIFMFICIYDAILVNSGVARKLHLDMWDWFALLVAAFSLCFTIMTWWSQDQTRENTAKLSTEDYRQVLADSYYNIVRNTINLYSLAVCLKNKYSEYYPSEEYLQKLKLHMFDAGQVYSQNIPQMYYGKFQCIAELCHYFNLHIDATQKHLSSKSIDTEIKMRDMETLKAMHWLVSAEMMKIIDYICPEDAGSTNRNIVSAKFKEIASHFAANDFSSRKNEYPSYIGTDNISFLKVLFESQQELETVINMLDSAIHSHLGNRADGYKKIPLIPIN